LVPEAEKAYPVMKDQLEAFISAKPEQRKVAAVFVMLHFPGMRPYVNAGVARTTEIEKIDNYRDNWWCGDAGAAIDENNFVKTERSWNKGDTSGKPKAAPGTAPFLSPQQQKAAAAEWRKLSASGAGSSYLTRQTLAWATANPEDPRIPEALHLAVRATHYGCADESASKLSRAAFTLLHDKYPNSKWTKQTEYWYWPGESGEVARVRSRARILPAIRACQCA